MIYKTFKKHCRYRHHTDDLGCVSDTCDLLWGKNHPSGEGFVDSRCCQKRCIIWERLINRSKNVCPACDGDGIVGYGSMVEHKCIKCSGTGRI
jgi:DnaJ-class molecular chaperone